MTASRNTRIAVTGFQSEVYHALLAVPEGMVTTYAAIGAAIGCRSAQAIGQALRKNPFAPGVPCHRVVRSDGHIGGFQGSRDGGPVMEKRKLLTGEGVVFDANGRVRPEHILTNLAAGNPLRTKTRKLPGSGVK